MYVTSSQPESGADDTEAISGGRWGHLSRLTEPRLGSRSLRRLVATVRPGIIGVKRRRPFAPAPLTPFPHRFTQSPMAYSSVSMSWMPACPLEPGDEVFVVPRRSGTGDALRGLRGGTCR